MVSDYDNPISKTNLQPSKTLGDLSPPLQHTGCVVVNRLTLRDTKPLPKHGDTCMAELLARFSYFFPCSKMLRGDERRESLLLKKAAK